MQIVVTEILVTYSGLEEQEARPSDGGYFDEKLSHIAVYSCPEPVEVRVHWRVLDVCARACLWV